MSVTRAYVDGHVTKVYLKTKLDAGLVLTDIIRDGHAGGDVAYLREGTADEIAHCRKLLEESSQ